MGVVRRHLNQFEWNTQHSVPNHPQIWAVFPVQPTFQNSAARSQHHRAAPSIAEPPFCAHWGQMCVLRRWCHTPSFTIHPFLTTRGKESCPVANPACAPADKGGERMVVVVKGDTGVGKDPHALWGSKVTETDLGATKVENPKMLIR